MLLKSIFRNRKILDGLGCLFWIIVLGGAFLFIHYYKDTNNSKAEVETPIKPCHIDTTITEFTISTAKELMEFAELANCGNDFHGKTIKLGANIMFNDTVNWRKWKNKPPAKEWIPIEDFGGFFDGKDYVIGGIYINSLNNKQGLFRTMAGTVKNLGVVASYIKGKDYVGGLAGRNNGIIIDSYFIGSVTGENRVGGLAGGSGGKIVNSYSKGTITID